MRRLAAEHTVSGESGAASTAGLMELMNGPGAAHVRKTLGLSAQTRALLISTEGATDPVAYQKIVGASA